MHAAVKIIIGLIIVLIGFGLFVDSPSLGVWKSITGINWWNNFLVVLTGVIPALLILIGIFVVWLEADELKAENELKTEETEEVKEAVAPGKKKGRPKRK
jgi:preprotein translocase subunit SecG